MINYMTRAQLLVLRFVKSDSKRDTNNTCSEKETKGEIRWCIQNMTDGETSWFKKTVKGKDQSPHGTQAQRGGWSIPPTYS